jgi:hypothetical protein
MKKWLLLPLMFWTVSAFSQFDSVPKVPNHHTDYTPLWCITLDDILTYQQECYNDSTQVIVHRKMGQYEYCLMDWECMSPGHHITIWQHRQPTFEGFIEWLKGRK